MRNVFANRKYTSKLRLALNSLRQALLIDSNEKITTSDLLCNGIFKYYMFQNYLYRSNSVLYFQDANINMFLAIKRLTKNEEYFSEKSSFSERSNFLGSSNLASSRYRKKQMYLFDVIKKELQIDSRSCSRIKLIKLGE